MAKTRIPLPKAWQEQMQSERRQLVLETPIADLLPIRTVNTLEEECGIIYVQDLLTKSRRELIALPNFGVKTVDEIAMALRRLGLTLASDEH